MAEDTRTVKYDYEGEFITNSCGTKLFTCRWQPSDQEPKALIFLLHAYAVECSVTLKDVGIRLVRAGYAVYGIDFEGHGKSFGLHGYIERFDQIVNDCCDYFTRICEMKENKEKRRYLFGECLGAAVALNLDRKMPMYWHGAVLVSPMCKIAEELRPNQLVQSTVKFLCKIIPTFKTMPTTDMFDKTIRNPEARVKIGSNPYHYKGRLRLNTANQLLFAILELEKNIHQVSLPFIICHGGQDVLIEPSGSKMLYEFASSTDKTFKLYPDMWHALLTGELPENINIVFSDIESWLDERSMPKNSMEQEDGEGTSGLKNLERQAASNDEGKRKLSM